MNIAFDLAGKYDHLIEEGKPSNFIILNAANRYDAVRKQSELLASYRKGKKIIKKCP